VSVACDYMAQVARGLQHAFEKGLVHRDIKPSNVVVQGAQPVAGTPVKILDMGLARVEANAAEESAALTQAQSVLGTPDFIAPEQARSAHDVDTRSDLYSLGCTFYFALTGQVPFPSETPMEKLLKHYLETARPVEELRPEIPTAVGQVVRRLMAKAPEKRYQTPAELVSVLGSVLNANIPVASAVPMALPVGPTEPELPAEPVPDDNALFVDDTLPEVAMEYDTADSIALVVKSRSGPHRKPRRRRGLLPFAAAAVAIGMVAALAALIVRYALH
jgi:serine/threonine protein kinase